MQATNVLRKVSSQHRSKIHVNVSFSENTGHFVHVIQAFNDVKTDKYIFLQNDGANKHKPFYNNVH